MKKNKGLTYWRGQRSEAKGEWGGLTYRRVHALKGCLKLEEVIVARTGGVE